MLAAAPAVGDELSCQLGEDGTESEDAESGEGGWLAREQWV